MSIIGKINSKFKEDDNLLEAYISYRNISRVLVNKISDLLPKKAILDCGKRLGIVKKKTLLLNNENDFAILWDFCLFHYYVNGKTAIDRYILVHKGSLTFLETEVALTMQTAEFALLVIENTLPNGKVLVKNLLGSGETELLMDRGISLSGKAGLMLASTILRFPKFIMTTGAALPVLTNSEELELLKSSYKSQNAFRKQDKAKFIAKFIKFSLEAEASEFIKYEEF
jgi:hypothetical protein